jgi:hypothetical protein
MDSNRRFRAATTMLFEIASRRASAAVGNLFTVTEATKARLER